MTIGEKIRLARVSQHMTQSEVVGDVITRNMLSAIESGKATPSLDTLLYLSGKLDLPIAYLLADEDISTHKRNDLIKNARKAFAQRNYDECISIFKDVDELDDEIAYILAYSNFECGIAAAKNGSFITAQEYLTLAKKYCAQTVYDTKAIECRIPLYVSFVKNVNSPLLEFDQKGYLDMMSDAIDYEFFKYICQDSDYQYEDLLFKKHFEAKNKMKERKYSEAIEILLDIADSKNVYGYNAYLIYCVYGDLDNCYKQICDFENAYKYSVKRISMLEGFNS